MNIPYSAGNLYAQVFLASVILTAGAFVGIWKVFETNSTQHQKFVSEIVNSTDPNVQEIWARSIKIQNENARIAIITLALVATATVALVVVSVGFWYYKIQRHLDRKLKLEAANLQVNFDDAQKARKPNILTD